MTSAALLSSQVQYVIPVGGPKGVLTTEQVAGLVTDSVRDCVKILCVIARVTSIKDEGPPGASIPYLLLWVLNTWANGTVCKGLTLSQLPNETRDMNSVAILGFHWLDHTNTCCCTLV